MRANRNWRRWADLETYLLVEYEFYWLSHTRATWLLTFNCYLCIFLICWYNFWGNLGLGPKKPPTFKPFYVRMCHRYMRWRSK